MSCDCALEPLAPSPHTSLPNTSPACASAARCSPNSGHTRGCGSFPNKQRVPRGCPLRHRSHGALTSLAFPLFHLLPTPPSYHLFTTAAASPPQPAFPGVQGSLAAPHVHVGSNQSQNPNSQPSTPIFALATSTATPFIISTTSNAITDAHHSVSSTSPASARASPPSQHCILVTCPPDSSVRMHVLQTTAASTAPAAIRARRPAAFSSWGPAPLPIFRALTRALLRASTCHALPLECACVYVCTSCLGP